MKFEEANLTEETKRALTDIGYIEMTEIQEKTIPAILDGKDVIGQSKTGTGKTASYALPIIEKINKDSREIQAIILCPTRELATQVTNEIRKFMKYKDSIKTVCVYGGQSIENQIRELKRGAQIIVGTPGRVMDHMRRGTVELNNVSMVVLDEADEMLDMGFEEDMETILKEVPETRQTLLFSATMSPRILKITKKYLTNPLNIKIKAEELTVNNTEQIVIEMKHGMKDESVTRILDVYDPRKAIIFCNTKKKVDDLIEILQKNGYLADAIHGDKNQDQRERIMKKFKRGDLRILIATDVAARGIDVENLDLVINYDIPQETEYYVHRIGRTGRNGNKGIAFTFVTGKERNKITNIEKFTKTKMENGKIPTITEVNIIKNQKRINEIQEEIDKMYAKESNQDYESNSLDNQQENKSNKNNKKAKERNKDQKNIDAENNALFEQLLKQNNNDIEKVAKALFKLTLNSRIKVEKNVSLENDVNEITDIKDYINESGYVKLFLNLGKKDKIMVKDIVGSISGNTAISGRDIGNIKLLDSFSFVEIPSEYVEEVMKKMKGKQIKGKDANFEIARN